MQLCFSTLACPAWPLTQILDAAETYQIPGIDFRGVGPDIDITKLPAFTTHLDSTVAELRRRNLSMPCLNTSITLVTPAPERWQMMLDECLRYASLASRTGTRLLRVFGGQVPKDLTRDEARNLARRHLRQLIKVCQPHHVLPVLETHDDWATSSEVKELFAETLPTEAGVLWDLEHPYRKGEPPAETAAGLARYLKHVHIKDSVRESDRNAPRLLGQGTLPLPDLLASLKSIRYDAWICLETEKRWHPEAPDPTDSLPQFTQWMRTHW